MKRLLKIVLLDPRWLVALGSVVVLLVAFFLYPFQIMVVPQWRLHVVDETGALVRDISVTEHWQHYLLEADGHDQILKTDESGLADFPARMMRASFASRIMRRIARSPRQGVEARSDPYASIVVWGSRDYETTVAVYQPGAPLPTEIVVHVRK